MKRWNQTLANVTHVHSTLTGIQPHLRLIEPCIPDFRSGIIASFKDKQETVDFYHEVARKYNNAIIKEAFTQASADEQNHAVWFYTSWCNLD